MSSSSVKGEVNDAFDFDENVRPTYISQETLVAEVQQQAEQQSHNHRSSSSSSASSSLFNSTTTVSQEVIASTVEVAAKQWRQKQKEGIKSIFKNL